MELSEPHRRAIAVLNDGGSTYDAIDAAIEACALRAEYGDCVTGMGCDDGYHPDSIVGTARKAAANDIRKLKFNTAT